MKCKVWIRIGLTRTALHSTTCLVEIVAASNLDNWNYLKPKCKCCNKRFESAKLWVITRGVINILGVSPYGRNVRPAGSKLVWNFLKLCWKDEYRQLYSKKIRCGAQHGTWAFGTSFFVVKRSRCQGTIDISGWSAYRWIEGTSKDSIGKVDYSSGWFTLVIVSSKGGLMTIKWIRTAELRQQIVPTRDVYEVRTNISFQILVTSLSKKPVVLHE